MKIIEGFELCSVMGKTMAVPSGELSKSFPGMIKMNEPAADVWRWVASDMRLADIVALYAETYDIDQSKAEQEVKEVISMMVEAGVLTE